MVRLEIGLPVEGDFFDYHAMVYDANLKHLYDNKKSVDIPTNEKKDLGDNRAATKVFKNYFKFATSLILPGVYKVSLKTATSPTPRQCPSMPFYHSKSVFITQHRTTNYFSPFFFINSFTLFHSHIPFRETNLISYSCTKKK